MFFGLTNSPATFQTMMDSLFEEEIASGDVFIYMDDILTVGSKTVAMFGCFALCVMWHFLLWESHLALAGSSKVLDHGFPMVF